MNLDPRLASTAHKQPCDFLPTASWENLRLRAALLRRLRAMFDQHGFIEVETPILSADTVVDRHIEPLAVVVSESQKLWLQTSPEFGMKRLLAAGAEAIYQVTRAFRANERGTLHNIEFTMVEWYRRGDSMTEGINWLSDLAEALLGLGPAERLSYGEAFQRYVGINPHLADVALLEKTVRNAGIEPPVGLPKNDRDGWLDLLLIERIEPHLGQDRPTILYDYPASQAALAQIRKGEKEGEPPVAKRFELYVHGIELANGYHELTDPDELRRRNAAINQQRIADGKSPLPESSRLLAAMEQGLPDSTGVALGFDRLVMLAAGPNAKSIADVIAFPSDRA